jgi:hypothetical protein
VSVFGPQEQRNRSADISGDKVSSGPLNCPHNLIVCIGITVLQNY